MSKSRQDYLDILNLPNETVHFIFSNLNNYDLRNSIMLVCKHFNKLLHNPDLLPNLLSRPAWFGVNYEKIAFAKEIAFPIGTFNASPTRCNVNLLPHGDIAISLNSSYFENESFSKLYQKSNEYRFYDNWKDSYQAILVFCTGIEQPIQLVGHQGGVKQVIQHNTTTLASIGSDNTIRIWDKYKGAQTGLIQHETIVNAFYLLSINNEEIACFNRNGTAHVWNTVTGKWVRKWLNFPTHSFTQCTIHGEYLILTSEVNDKEEFSIWGIKEGKIIQHSSKEKIKSALKKSMLDTYRNKQHFTAPEYLSKKIELACYHSDIAVIMRNKTTYLLDTKCQNIFFSFPLKHVKYKLLDNGNLIILYLAFDNWHVLTDYCSTTQDFKIHNLGSLDEQLVILNNGNILGYNCKTDSALQWSLSTQSFLPEFQLQPLTIPFNLNLFNYNRYNLDVQFTCLRNNNILAYSRNGIIAIWDEVSGKLLFNSHVAGILGENKENLIVDNFKCVNMFQNGDLFFNWRIRHRDKEGYSFKDHYDGKILQFNSFQSNQIVKDKHCINNSIQSRVSLLSIFGLDDKKDSNPVASVSDKKQVAKSVDAPSEGDDFRCTLF